MKKLIVLFLFIATGALAHAEELQEFDGGGPATPGAKMTYADSINCKYTDGRCAANYNHSDIMYNREKDLTRVTGLTGGAGSANPVDRSNTQGP